MPQPVIAVIGASGMVGMATLDTLQLHTSADIIAVDRKAEGEQLEKRAQRKANYELLKSKGQNLLDSRQANWLLRGVPEATALGAVTSLEYDTNLKELFAHNPTHLLITAGVARTEGRKEEEKFSPLIPLNTPYFSMLSRQIADGFASSVQGNERPPFPLLINTSNPVDSMTELLMRGVSKQLAVHVRSAVAGNQTDKAVHLANVIKTLPTRIIGQGGVLDGARAAMAISETLKIPMQDILIVPVLGPHNKHMIVDIAGIRVQQYSDVFSLRAYAEMALNEVQIQAIIQGAVGGAAAVAKDIKEQTGLAQTAVFGTAAAVTKMMVATLHAERTPCCAAVFEPLTNRTMGRPVLLSAGGAELVKTLIDPELEAPMYRALGAIRTAYDAVEGVLLQMGGRE